MASDSETSASYYNSDAFRIYCFKVVLCDKPYQHDRLACPFYHHGEIARRRDPRTHRASVCSSMRAGAGCSLGDACPHAHNVFELRLHPSTYRTSMCSMGAACTRKVCFFAHSESELRHPTHDAALNACTQCNTVSKVMRPEVHASGDPPQVLQQGSVSVSSGSSPAMYSMLGQQHQKQQQILAPVLQSDALSIPSNQQQPAQLPLLQHAHSISPRDGYDGSFSPALLPAAAPMNIQQQRKAQLQRQSSIQSMAEATLPASLLHILLPEPPAEPGSWDAAPMLDSPSSSSPLHHLYQQSPLLDSPDSSGMGRLSLPQLLLLQQQLLSHQQQQQQQQAQQLGLGSTSSLLPATLQQPRLPALPALQQPQARLLQQQQESNLHALLQDAELQAWHQRLLLLEGTVSALTLA